MSQDNERVTKVEKIPNILNDYFSKIEEKTKPKIRFSYKSFDEFHQDATKYSVFLKPTSSDESLI